MYRYFISYTTSFGFGNNILELDKEIETMEDIIGLSDRIKNSLNERHKDKIIHYPVEQVIILNFQLIGGI